MLLSARFAPGHTVEELNSSQFQVHKQLVPPHRRCQGWQARLSSVQPFCSINPQRLSSCDRQGAPWCWLALHLAVKTGPGARGPMVSVWLIIVIARCALGARLKLRVAAWVPIVRSRGSLTSPGKPPTARPLRSR